MFERTDPFGSLKALFVTAALFGLLYLAYSQGYSRGEYIGYINGEIACPQYQSARKATAEAQIANDKVREAEALLHSRRVNVCDAIAKEAWYEDNVSEICYEYMGNLEDQDYPVPVDLID